jgi:tetratricopeptide (TPR) repeat protein
MRERCVAASAVLFLFSGLAWSARVVQVRGELTCDSCNYYTGYSVEFHDPTGNRPPERVLVRNTGEFDARVESGDYTLTVMSAGAIVKSENVSVRDALNAISIGIPNLEGGSRPGAGVISISRMRHKVPKAAEKAYKAADKKYHSKDVDGSIEDLKRATEIDGEYLEAWNNLGCRYLLKGQAREALAALERAAHIDKDAPFVHTNIAIAQISLANFVGAEQAARSALSVDSSDKKARYVLGMTLVAQQKYTDETLKVLRQVEEDFPMARLALAETLAKRGNVEQAKTILKHHLSSGDDRTRPQAEAMLASLH